MASGSDPHVSGVSDVSGVSRDSYQETLWEVMTSWRRDWSELTELASSEPPLVPRPVAMAELKACMIATKKSIIIQCSILTYSKLFFTERENTLEDTNCRSGHCLE